MLRSACYFGEAVRSSQSEAWWRWRGESPRVRAVGFFDGRFIAI